jgi:hypothetical protein
VLGAEVGARALHLVVVDHLQGRHVMGVYPLLEDERCWFLAATSTRRRGRRTWPPSRRLAVAIERSRSGNGAHAWFFFVAPVLANVARRMGCYLMTETMSRRHELSMESYDRLLMGSSPSPISGRSWLPCSGSIPSQTTCDGHPGVATPPSAAGGVVLTEQQ